MSDMTPSAPSTGNPAIDGAASPSTPQVRMVRSLEALVKKQDALIGIMAEVAKEISILSERSAAFSGGSSRSKAPTLTRASSVYREGSAARASGGVPPARPPEASFTQPVPAAMASASRLPAPIPPAIATPPQQSDKGVRERQTEAQDARSRQMGLPETWAEGMSPQALPAFRKRLGQRFGEIISQWDPAAGDVQLPDGTFMPRDVYENAIAGSPDTPGWFSIDGVGPNEPGHTGFLLRRGASMFASDVGSAIGRGQGLGSALQAARIPGLGTTVGKVLGPIGLAVGGMQAGLNFAESQREQNLRYQRVLGGENFEGFSQRLSRNIFGLSMMGRMGNETAGQIFDDALNTYGNNDQMRQRYVSAATELYMGSGITPEQSEKLLGSAAKVGENNLMGLVDAIKRLGTQAYETGVLATRATGGFAAMYEALSPQLGSQAASQISESLTAVGMEFAGNEMDNVQVAGMTVNSAALSIAGSNLGMTGEQVLAMSASSNPADQVVSMEALANVEAQGLQSLIYGSTAQLRQAADAYFRQDPIGENGEINANQDERQEFGRQLQAQGLISGLNSGAESLLRNLGITITGNTDYWLYMGDYVIGLVYRGVGITRMGQAAARVRSQTEAVANNDLASAAPDLDLSVDANAATRRLLAGEAGLDLNSNLGGSYVSQLVEGMEEGETTVDRSFIIEQLLKGENRSTDKFIVQSYNDKGETGEREVSLEQAINNPEYYKQLATGVARRSGSGTSLSQEVLGSAPGQYTLPDYESYQASNTANNPMFAGEWKGEKAPFNNRNAENGGGDTEDELGRVVVEFAPSPFLQNFLRVQVMGMSDGAVPTPLTIDDNQATFYTHRP